MKIIKNPLFQYLTFLFLLVFLLVLFSIIIKVKIVSLAQLYMFTPFLALLIYCLLNSKSLFDYGVSFNINWWFLYSILIPIILIFSTMFVGFLFPGVSYTPTMDGILIYGASEELVRKSYKLYSSFFVHPLIFLTISGILAGSTINAIFAFGEEIGWRGFLYSYFQHPGFWKSSFIIGIIWGIWHIPLVLNGYNYPSNPILGSFLIIIFTTFLSPIINFIRLKSNSIIATSIMHGTINALAGIPIAFSIGNSLIIGFQGISGIIVLIIMNFIIYLIMLYEK